MTEMRNNNKTTSHDNVKHQSSNQLQYQLYYITHKSLHLLYNEGNGIIFFLYWVSITLICWNCAKTTICTGKATHVKHNINQPEVYKSTIWLKFRTCETYRINQR